MDDITCQMIEFPSNAHSTPGFLAQLAGPGPHPGVVVIQEWWGLVPHIMDVAQRFARQGFVALAPDLYHGHVASEPDEARKLAMELDRERAVAEIIAAMRCLQNLEQVAPKKVGVVGWCMGGSLAITTAAANPQTGAAVAFYGMPRSLDIVQSIRCPVLGLYGEHDHGISLEMVHAFDVELEKHGVTHEVHIYSGAEHAFFNDSRPHIYNAPAAQDAWQRTLDWFRAHLSEHPGDLLG
jgi:carboxymethylenebutenolidase